MSELPNGWEQLELADCVEILDSKRKPVNNRERQSRVEGKLKSELYPYYGATGQVGYIDDYLFNEELVALGEDGVPFFDPLKHKAYIISGKTWVNNHAHVLKGVKVNNRYLCYYLNQANYHGYVNGATRLKLTQANMRKMPIKVAPLEEQKRIADKLDSVIAKVEAAQTRLDKIPAILKRFRQSVLAAATSGELTKDWRGGEPFMADDIELKEVVEIDIGHAFKSKEFEDKGIRLLRGQNIEPGALRWSETKYFPKDKLHKFSHLFIRTEDIILAMDRPIVSAGLKLAKAKESDLPCVLVQRVARFSPSAQIVNDFLYYLLLSPDFSSYLLPKQTGSDIPHISGKQILNYSLQLPHIDEQKAIVAMVSELFEHASSVQKQYSFAKTRLDKLTQSILAKAFRGELLSSTVDSDIEAIENSVEALNA